MVRLCEENGMANLIKPYIYAGLAIVTVVVLYLSYTAGKRSVVERLQSDRIEVLRDGRQIDETVFAADDLGLICLLIDCDN